MIRQRCSRPSSRASAMRTSGPRSRSNTARVRSNRAWRAAGSRSAGGRAVRSMHRDVRRAATARPAAPCGRRRPGTSCARRRGGGRPRRRPPAGRGPGAAPRCGSRRPRSRRPAPGCRGGAAAGAPGRTRAASRRRRRGRRPDGPGAAVADRRRGRPVERLQSLLRREPLDEGEQLLQVLLRLLAARPRHRPRQPGHGGRLEERRHRQLDVEGLAQVGS